MIWWLLAVYALAGVTIGRMTYEFDVFDPPFTNDPEQAVRNRTVEVRACWMIGVAWPVVPFWALWVHVKTPRRTS